MTIKTYIKKPVIPTFSAEEVPSLLASNSAEVFAFAERWKLSITWPGSYHPIELSHPDLEAGVLTGSGEVLFREGYNGKLQVLHRVHFNSQYELEPEEKKNFNVEIKSDALDPFELARQVDKARRETDAYGFGRSS